MYDVSLCKITTSVTRNISVFSVQERVYDGLWQEASGNSAWLRFGDGQRAKWAKCYFPVPCPFCKLVCGEAGSKQNQFSDLGQHITAPLKKN